MRKIIHLVHVSLDGHIEGPDGEFDWPVLGPELSAYSLELNNEVDGFLYGRVVWEMMSSFWPQAELMSDDPHDLAFAPIWRDTPKFVLSTTLEKAGWNTRVLGGNLAEEVTELKRRSGKDLVLMGGSGAASSLTALGLIDDYRVVVDPVVLGGGKPLFAKPGERLGLELIESRTFDGRAVRLRYRPAAEKS